MMELYSENKREEIEENSWRYGHWKDLRWAMRVFNDKTLVVDTAGLGITK